LPDPWPVERWPPPPPWFFRGAFALPVPDRFRLRFLLRLRLLL